MVKKAQTARKPAKSAKMLPAEVPPLAQNRLLATRTLSPADAVDRQQVVVNLAESPLAWLARRGLLSPAQCAAGERLRMDFMAAGQAPRVTMRWDPVPAGRQAAAAPGPAPHAAERQLFARDRLDAALAAAGPGLADVCWRVLCLGEGLETAERAMGWPSRAGKLVLTLALDRLVAHYGIDPSLPEPAL